MCKYFLSILTSLKCNNYFVRGRLGNIKKSIILRISIVILFLLFLVSVLLNIFIIDIPTFWFYLFCLSIGIFQTLKSRLYKLDSSFYLGILLLLIGTSGMVYIFTSTITFAHIYILSDFVLASILTFFICGQRFHLIIAYSLFFVLIFVCLYTFSLISLLNLIAILVSFLVLLIIAILIEIFGSKK